MKKILTCVCIVSLLLLLCACEPEHFFFDYDELKESVVSVEYIYYDNSNAKELDETRYDKSDQLLPFDFEKMEIRQVLPFEKLDDFLKDLSEHHLLILLRHDDSPNGYCMRVIYDNGDFDILSCDGAGYCGSFYADGQVKRFIGSWGYDEEFWLKYFDIPN